MNRLDLICIGILVASGLIAYKRGLLKTLYGFCSTLVSAIVGYFVYPYVSRIIINNTGLMGKIKEKVIISLKLDEMTGSSNEVIQGLKLPDFIKDILISKENQNSVIYKLLDAESGSVADYVGGTIATLIINVFTFIAVLIVVTIICHLITGLMNWVTKLPVIHSVNKIGGLVVGLVWGVLLIWLICTVLTFVSGIQNSGKLVELIDNSSIFRLFNNSNLIMNWLKDFKKSLVK